MAAAPAATTDLTLDTFSALAAFIVPGDDSYSVAQGETVGGPGGVASGAVSALISVLDKTLYVSVAGADAEAPVSRVVSVLLNETALTVDPVASNGGFLSPFARLSFTQKGEVFARLEEQGRDNELGLLVGELCGLTAFLCYSEVAVYDPVGRSLKGSPVGWTISRYPGVTEGRPEFRGYWQGRTAADPGSAVCQTARAGKLARSACRPAASRGKRHQRHRRRRRQSNRRRRAQGCRTARQRRTKRRTHRRRGSG